MKHREALLLLAVVCIIATCGLVYELCAGTLASYLLGDSVKQFSLVIGIYLFAMGIGAYVSNHIKTQLLDRFIQIEFLVGIIGGISSMSLLFLFNYAEGFEWMLYVFITLTGILVGIEIPLLMRLLKDNLDFGKLVSRVLTFDYIGALLASVIFPLICIPYLGLAKTSLFFGLLNIFTGLLTAFLFRKSIRWYKQHIGLGLVCGTVLAILFGYSNYLQEFLEGQTFPGKIIHAESSPYQRIVVTRNATDVRLYLNNNLQFSSQDEHRYHEALVYPAIQGSQSIKHVLILGGGDGLAAREVLRNPEVDSVTLVDLDPSMTRLFQHHQLLKNLNQGSLNNPKLHLVHDDAFIWLRKHKQLFDCILVDFPDPSNYAIAKLYTNVFYTELAQHLRHKGCAVIQCTSPFAAKQSFWTIENTIRSTGLNTIPYYNTVPSFGIWGYILCTKDSLYKTYRKLPPGLKFYKEEQFVTMRHFSDDMLPKQLPKINKLSDQVLVHLFEEEWDKYMQ